MKYPLYVPSKGRAATALTPRFLDAEGVDFRLVIEEQEFEDYAAAWGEERLLVLPFSNRGTVVPARNWIWEHSIEEGHERHWQLDDNIRYLMRWYKGKRIRCDADVALSACEEFTDRYENIAVSGLMYGMFAVWNMPPFELNVHVYSCTLHNNAIPWRYRGKYNEDTDLCLQVLSQGWCTVLLTAFLCNKMRTMTMKGGNDQELYQEHDGRLKMAKALERKWPGVVRTQRRFQRPQHHVYDSWKRFDTPLKLKPGIDLSKLPKVDEKGLTLKGKNVESARLKKLIKAHRATKKR